MHPGVRSSKDIPIHSQPRPHRNSANEGPALIMEDDIIGDDWMEDDLGIGTSRLKRKRTDVDGPLRFVEQRSRRDFP